jgi:hypothetical protein
MVARWQLLVWLLVAALLVQGQLAAVGRARAAAPSGPQSQVDAEGVAHVLAIKVPASKFMSAEARTRFIRLFSGPRPPPLADMRLLREADEQKNAPFVARAEALYPVTIEPKIIVACARKSSLPKTVSRRAIVSGCSSICMAAASSGERATARDPSRYRSPG